MWLVSVNPFIIPVNCFFKRLYFFMCIYMSGLHLALICPQSPHDTLLPSLGSESKGPSEGTVVQVVRDGRPEKVKN